MAPKLGFTSLLLITALNFFLPLICLYYRKALTKNPKLLELEKISSFVTIMTFFLAIFSQCCLIYSYIISDYSVVNVYQNSHHLKPLIYRISGSWGNHEGSMLLLITILSSYNLLFYKINNSEFKIISLSSQAFIVASFAFYTALASNPFEISFNIPKSGLGLNPLLQDIGLALHPPMLYIGYIGFFITFSLAISGLLQEKVTKDLARNIQPYLFLSWSFLSLGIGLGSWWAYRELGWGGYWFWDPVENVSLMPWLSATALIHTVKILEKKGQFKIWTILLSIITFILSLIGIFLVRSGLLTSVHSFAVDAKRGFFIILLITIIGGISLLIFALKAHKLKETKVDHNKILSKSFSILMNNYILIIALFTMVLGIFYPIFAREFFDLKLSVGANYYNKIFAILLLPFLFFLFLSYFNEARSYKNFINKKTICIFFSSLILSLLFVLNSVEPKILETTLLFLSFLSFFLALTSKKSVTNLAHLSFTMIFIGIILNSYLGSTKEINIKENQEISISKNSDLKVKFKSVKYDQGKNYLTRKTIFEISKNDKIITELKPELRFYPISDQTTFEADIYHGIFGDLYLAAGNKDEEDNYALRIYYKPFIYLIWLGCLLMFFAGIKKVFKRLLIKN